MNAKTKIKIKPKLSPQAVIVSEISVLEHQLKKDQLSTERAARKVEVTHAREMARLERLRRIAMAASDKALQAAIRLHGQRDRAHERLAKAHAKRSAATRRRLSILEGRLNAL